MFESKEGEDILKALILDVQKANSRKEFRRL